MKTKTYVLCKTRADMLNSLDQHKQLMIDPEGHQIILVFCACHGYMAASTATVRMLKAAGWIERVGQISKANGGIFYEKWGISKAGRLAIGSTEGYAV